jgi:hypothetical protein
MAKRKELTKDDTNGKVAEQDSDDSGSDVSLSFLPA